MGLLGEIINAVGGDNIEKAVNYVSKQYGVIHDSAPIKYNGEAGTLVWDYILVNELTFESQSTGKQISLFTSISDTETQKKFDDYVRKFGN